MDRLINLSLSNPSNLIEYVISMVRKGGYEIGSKKIERVKVWFITVIALKGVSGTLFLGKSFLSSNSV